MVDINHDITGKAVIPTRKQIAELRTTLKELALQAEVCSELSERSDVNPTSSRRDETTSSWTSPVSIDADDPNQGSAASRSGQRRSSAGSSSPSSFTLKFLQKALPDIPTAKLKDALDAHDGDDLDLWDVIATILSQESIRELEERGLDAFEEEERDTSPFSADLSWEIVKRKKPPPETVKQLPTKNKTSSKSKPKKLVLSDVRQQHHAQKNQQYQGSTHRNRSNSSAPQTDPWTQLSSLANQLSTLLPPTPASYFSSHFHSPAHATSYEAAQAALMSLCQSDTSGNEAEEATVVLINLLDIVMPENEDLNFDQRARIISDTELAITVTEGRTNDALELTYLLRDLDTLGIGVNHLPLPPSPSSPTSPTRPVNFPGPKMRPLSQGSTERGTKFPSPSPPSSTLGPSRVQASGDRWQSVPSCRKGKRRGSHSLRQLAHSIDDKHDADYFTLRMRQAMARRNQALMTAAIMYRKGNRMNRCGDVAMYYAEKVCKENYSNFQVWPTYSTLCRRGRSRS